MNLKIQNNLVKFNIFSNNNNNTGVSKEEYNKQLRKVSEEFAAWYVYEVFKKMYNTVPKSGFIQEGFGEQWFREMLLQQYAMKSARTDLKDLADMIYKSLGGKNYSEDIHSPKTLINKKEALNLLHYVIFQKNESIK